MPSTCIARALFVDFQIGDQPEPEGMQEMEGETLLTIQKAEPEDVAPQEIRGRAHRARQSGPGLLLPFCPFVGITECGRLYRGRRQTALPARFFPRRQLRITKMLLDPEIDFVFL